MVDFPLRRNICVGSIDSLQLMMIQMVLLEGHSRRETGGQVARTSQQLVEQRGGESQVVGDLVDRTGKKKKEKRKEKENKQTNSKVSIRCFKT